jgi:FkbH-like protein
MDSTALNYPLDPALILRKKRSLKKSLAGQISEDAPSKKIAILGGSTTGEILQILELFLLNQGIRPSFYESDFNRYYEDAIFENSNLRLFNPDIFIIHTSSLNIQNFPSAQDNPEQIEAKIKAEADKIEKIWTALSLNFKATIIQNNFEYLSERTFGHLDTLCLNGKNNFLLKLNSEALARKDKHKNVFLHDIHYLSSLLGLEKWFDPSLWFTAKYALSYEAIPHYCHSLSTLIASFVGKNSKVLSLDLDNTLWSGVIGDDGADGIILGNDHPVGEAHTDFQRYAKELKERGVVLTINSKNSLDNAKLGLSHPDSILTEKDFSLIKANWEPKDNNLSQTAVDINLGLDSFVFIDDNPAERERVQASLPMVKVPNVGSNIVNFKKHIDRNLFFTITSFSIEDTRRTESYLQNQSRQNEVAKFLNHEDYLRSLEMVSEIDYFRPIYEERILQLINKTNQFNTTTKRVTANEICEIKNNPNYIGLYAKLSDKFGDSGLVSVLWGKTTHDEIEIENWVMSCRVFQRGLEQAFFSEFLKVCQERGLKKIIATYIPSSKNQVVSHLYPELGFHLLSTNDNIVRWYFNINSHRFKYFITLHRGES